MKNIIDILKFVKKGFVLYSPIYGDVVFDGFHNDIIRCITTSKDGTGYIRFFNKYGQVNYYDYDSECMLYPSKNNKDWDNFSVLDRHTPVMCSNDGKTWELFKYFNMNKCYIETPLKYKTFKYIVPIKKFDFDQPFTNSKNSII